MMQNFMSDFLKGQQHQKSLKPVRTFVSVFVDCGRIYITLFTLFHYSGLHSTLHPIFVFCRNHGLASDRSLASRKGPRLRILQKSHTKNAFDSELLLPSTTFWVVRTCLQQSERNVHIHSELPDVFETGTRVRAIILDRGGNQPTWATTIGSHCQITFSETSQLSLRQFQKLSAFLRQETDIEMETNSTLRSISEFQRSQTGLRFR